MKLAIRLQNHGRKNHPYWWIVVAPNRRNIFGRFTEHVGYWSPRHGVHLQRQIVLNLPRIKYWMSCGAVPTFKVHKFLSYWGVLPAPWYYQKSQQQIIKEQPKEQQLTDKKKRKLEWKQKKRSRQILDPINYYKQESRVKWMSDWKKKMDDLKRAQQRQNELLRQLLLHHEFNKLAKINQLSGKSTFTDTQQLNKLKQSLAKAKAQLTFIQKNNPNYSFVQQTKTIKVINDLCDKIRDVDMNRRSNINIGFEELQSKSQYLTEDLLKAKLQYENITKKIEKNFEELQQYALKNQPVLLQEYADFLVQKKKIDPQQAYIQAQRQFIQRGVSGNPMTRVELDMWDYIKRFQKQQSEDDDLLHPELRDADTAKILKKAIQLGDCILPTRRTVHPIPDLTTYIPEQYYQPLASHSFQIKMDDSLSPYDELQKYHQKKGKKSKIVI